MTFGKMRSASHAALVALLAFAFASPSGAKPTTRAGEIIVKFKDSATAAERTAIENDIGLVQVDPLSLIHAEHGKASKLTVEQAIARYQGNPKVAYIEPNYIYQASAVPNDPQFPQLWEMQNTGQTGGKPGADISATSAWSQFTGTRSVIVAIIDSGMDYNHVDLAANAWVNPGEIPNNGLDDDGNGFVDDVHGWDFANNDKDPIDDVGHGTHCSGTIGAVGNNGIGVVGVNWNVSLMPVKFLDATGSGSTSAAVSAIQYAVRMGAKIISASWGGPGASQALEDAIAAAGQADVLFVAAAGNSGQNTDFFPNYPSSYTLDNIIAVAASDHNDQLATFSNYGVASVDLAAPGVDILSTLPGGYGLLSGTSMATPHVAGAAALILGRFPGIGALNAKNLLLHRVDALSNLTGLVSSGGRLNAFLPIATPDSTPPAAITDLHTANAGGRNVTLYWTATGDDGSLGTASAYQVRYSPSPIGEANFASATLWPTPPAPAPAGTPQSTTVTGLAFGTHYYFAIKAYDEFGNASAISNPATGTTLPPPNVAVTPSSLSASLLTGQKITQTLTITNTGASDLNFSIDILSSPAAAQAWRVAPTFRLLNAATSRYAAYETPPPTHPLSMSPYSQGHAPGRAGLTPAEIRITNTLATGLRVLILESGADVSEIRTLLSAFPDIAGVDVFDGTVLAPTLSDLTPYRSVIVVDNTHFGDPVATGNALADYVDQGGGVVLTLASFITGWDIRGRLLSDGYMPYNLGTGPGGSSPLGTFNAAHPIMAGVHAATGDLLGIVTVSPGAELVASWANGLPCVATKGTVAAVNVFLGQSGSWTGDIPLILHNAAFWSSGSVRWLTPDPAAGVVPAGGQLAIAVTFDATGLNGGDYTASLVLKSDDPDQASLPIPAHLHVTGAPNISLAGEEVSIESAKAYFVTGGATDHELALTVPPTAGGRLELVADGDYGNFGETATLSAEGLVLGTAGEVGSDCVPATASFPISAATLATWAADGVVHAHVQNSGLVDVFCPVNRHTVRLVYSQGTDSIAFGSLFVGGLAQRLFLIRNVGTDLLHVTSLAIDDPSFTVGHASVDLPPDGVDSLVVNFRPLSATQHHGTLTIQSNDPDQPTLTVALSGEGLVPPDIDVAPLALHADLLTGDSTSRTVTVTNRGLSDLTFTVDVAGPGLTVGVATTPPRPPVPGHSDHVLVNGSSPAVSLDEGGPLTSTTVPTGYHAASSREVHMSGARVLIIQDVAPWGTQANEQVLNDNHIAFDVISSAALAATSLSAYRLVLVPSDQPSTYYATVGSQRAKLEAFVTLGGVLEVHAAGWGSNGGDASVMVIPGGMHIVQHLSTTNLVLTPGHPLVAGVPNPFTGNYASHAYFTGVPAGATVVAGDESSDPNLVVYALGAGTVVAGGQTFEYGFVNAEDPGRILRNSIPYSYRPGPGWLSAGPSSGRIPPGGSATITVTFDARGLNGGDYAGTVAIRSNDPDEPQIPVSSTLHVTGAPDIVVRGRLVSVTSTQPYNTPQAVTTHHLAVPPGTTGDAEFDLDVDGDYGDFTETATATAEGLPLGEAGRVGTDCSPGHASSTIAAADLARLVADGVVDVEVRNSFDVDLFCITNQHKVTLRYREPASPVTFGSLFVGLCALRNLEVQNTGTDVLTISSVRVTGSGFSVLPTSLTLQPGQLDTLAIRFCPLTAQVVSGTLIITSNDADHGTLTFALQGEGLVAPDIDVTPTALHEDLLTGQVHSRTLNVQNLGGSNLEIAVEARNPGIAIAIATPPSPNPPVGRDGLTAGAPNALANDEPGPVLSNAAPNGYRSAASSVIRMAGAQVLLVQDTAPWGTTANETILNSLGIAYDRIPSAQLGATSLASYRLLIIPSDQPTSYYRALNLQLPRLESFVNGGGVLEAHAAGWGSAAGDASVLTLPGGLHIVNRFADVNTILDPSHPIVAGVPNPFRGTSASHANFTNIPADAQRIVSDDTGTANLIVYRMGGGLVVAAGQTLEYGYATGQSAGLLLRNIIPFAYRPAPLWLDVGPATATVPPGGFVTITVTFNATGLSGGNYSGDIRLTSNDPDESLVTVPASLHVTGVPDLAVLGRQVSVASQKDYTVPGAVTLHHLVLEPSAPTAAELEVDIDGDYGDFVETATVFVDGFMLGQLGRLGTDCTGSQATFPISPQQFAAIIADSAADVRVENSSDVDVFCTINRHRVEFRYRVNVNPMDLGSSFVGTCATQVVQAVNRGSDDLVVTGLRTSNPAFSVTPTQFTLRPDSSEDIAVRFCPTSPGAVSGTLTIVSNDPDGDFVINLHATGLVPPNIAMARTSVSEDVMVGQTSTVPFVIANTGGSDLTVRLNLQLAGPTALARPSAGAAADTPGPASPIDVSAVRQSYAAFANAAPPAGLTQLPGRERAPFGTGSAAPRTAVPATPATLIPSVVPIFADDFEGADKGWTHTAEGPDRLDLWAITTTRASSGARSWHVSQHAGTGADALVSPPISLAGYQDAALSFRHWYNFDDCQGTVTFEPDGGLLEVRVVGTPVWTQIEPAGHYPDTLDFVCGNPLQGRPAYSHDSGQGLPFVGALFDLSAFAGETIQFRFLAGWDCGNCENNEGWYIDDVLVYSNAPSWFSVRPLVATIPAGEVQSFDFRFDAASLAAGRYHAQAIVSSNDPDTPSVTIPVELRVANVTANLDVDPNSINLGSKGNFITAYLELPPGHDVNEIDAQDLTLNGIEAEPNPTSVGDHDGDGLTDIMFKFDRAAVSSTLEEGDVVRIHASGGMSAGNRLLAEDRIRVIRHHVTSPAAGEIVVAGTSYAIRWSLPQDWKPDFAEVVYSLNNGASWIPIARNVPGTSYTWTVPEITADGVRVRVGLFGDGKLLSYASNAGVFRIRSSTTDAGGPPAPGRQMLTQNVPNPFQAGHSTTIAYQLSAPSPVNLAIYSPAGRLVRVLVDGVLPAGRHQVTWDGHDGDGRRVGPGIYFVQMRATAFKSSRSMILLN